MAKGKREEPPPLQQVAILFADVSGFTTLEESELAAFVEHTMKSLSEVIRSRQPRVQNTWGDALFLVFDTAGAAASCALDLRDRIRNENWRRLGLLKPLQMRIALHNAHASIRKDPLTGRTNAYGFHINATARLEPVTLPNEVFGTYAFKVALDQERLDQFVWDHIGPKALAKNFGQTDVFRLRRPSERELSIPQLEGHSKPPSLDSLMPSTRRILETTPLDAGDLHSILKHVDGNIVGPGIVRRNLQIDVRYGVSRLRSKGIIDEYGIWNYELVNVLNSSVTHEVRLTSVDDFSLSKSYSYHLIDEEGVERPIAFPDDASDKGTGLLTSRSQTVELKPRQRLKVELRFSQFLYANPDHPYVHNTFQSTTACFQNRLIIRGPIEEASIYCGSKPPPLVHRGDDEFIYNVPSPLLPYQGIEWILKFRPVPSAG